jgi:hypothetical protein
LSVIKVNPPLLLCDLNAAECGLVIDRPLTRGEDWNDALRVSAAKGEHPALHLHPCTARKPGNLTIYGNAVYDGDQKCRQSLRCLVI